MDVVIESQLSQRTRELLPNTASPCCHPKLVAYMHHARLDWTRNREPTVPCKESSTLPNSVTESRGRLIAAPLC